MKPKLSVAGKLIAAFAVVIALTCVLGWVGLRAAGQANDQARDTNEHEIAALAELSEITASAFRVRELALLFTLAGFREELDRLQSEIDQQDADVARSLATLAAISESEGERRGVVRLRESWRDYVEARDTLTLRLAREGDSVGARAAASGPVAERFTRVDLALGELHAQSTAHAAERLAAAENGFSDAKRLVLGLLVGIVVLALAVALAVSRRIAGGVGRVARAAEALAAGDLARRAEVTSGDEIGVLARSFNDMAEQLETRERRREALADLGACAVSEADLDVLFAGAAAVVSDALGVDRRTALKLLPEARTWDGDGSTLDAARVRAADHPLGEAEAQFLEAVTAILAAAVRRRRAEAALAASEARYRSLIQNSSDLTLLIGADGRIEFASPSAARVAGCRPEELVDRNALAFVHAEDRARVATGLAGVAAGPGASAEGEFRVRDATDGWVHLDATALNLTHDPAVRAIVFNGRDVSERRRAEEEQRQLEEQLRQSQKMEAIGRLAGGIAHDFNNLLTAILGYCQLSSQHMGDERGPLRGYLEEIGRAADRAAGLTTQLLAYSRKQMLRPRVFHLDAVVLDLESMLRRIIGEHIDLRVALAPDLAPVRADPHQIEQVIVNLAVNARDAMPEGGTLTIETANIELGEEYARSHAEVVPGPYVLLAVSDTGVGMDEYTRSRVFEPFFTTKEQGKGTGLGLATVHGIVKQSGGHIAVYSEPRAGTSFKVYLPAVDEAADAEREGTVAIETLEGTETILLVEDEDAVRSLARRVLEALGYTVLEARDGPEALAMAEGCDGEIHLVLTDVVLPSVNGRQVYQQVEAVRPGVRVLYMSGYTENAIVHGGTLDTDAPFIAKPFRPEALARRVRGLLDA